MAVVHLMCKRFAETPEERSDETREEQPVFPNPSMCFPLCSQILGEILFLSKMHFMNHLENRYLHCWQ